MIASHYCRYLLRPWAPLGVHDTLCRGACGWMIPAATARVVGDALVPDVCSLGLVRGVWGLAFASGLWPARGVVEILRACFGLAVGRFEHLRAVGVADDGGTRSPSVGLFSAVNCKKCTMADSSA